MGELLKSLLIRNKKPKPLGHNSAQRKVLNYAIQSGDSSYLKNPVFGKTPPTMKEAREWWNTSKNRSDQNVFR